MGNSLVPSFFYSFTRSVQVINYTSHNCALRDCGLWRQSE